LIIEDIITFVIQINGKKRGTLEVNMNVLEEEILKKINQDKKLKKYLNEKEIKKKIFIPNKLMNIII
jgi:leucyl-tRNA synthetase